MPATSGVSQTMLCARTRWLVGQMYNQRREASAACQGTKNHDEALHTTHHLVRFRAARPAGALMVELSQGALGALGKGLGQLTWSLGGLFQDALQLNFSSSSCCLQSGLQSTRSTVRAVVASQNNNSLMKAVDKLHQTMLLMAALRRTACRENIELFRS